MASASTQSLPYSGTVKGPLSIAEQVRGKTLFVMGGTGFLGKVWLCMLLARFPEVEHIYLVVRPRKRKDGSIRLSSEDRFWSQIVCSEVFDPIREQHGAGYEDFIRAKITPLAGDVSEDFAGVSAELRQQLRGKVDALVNVAGIVDFTPPLDYALNANAFGMQNLIALCKDLGDQCRMMHTSTCYVAGDRTGQVDEIDPKIFPFPKAETLDISHWDPAREIAECVDMVESVRHRANDAFRQSEFLDQAKQNLERKGEPTRGTALRSELEKVKRKFIEARLKDDGAERAKFWGWHNTYTYTKSIGEQILCHSGLEFTIVRPAVIESALDFPRVGWCEGINTSAPLIFLTMNSPVIGIPASKEAVLDIIPVDMVAAGMVLALAELLEGSHEVVYQLGSSDTAPLPMYRLIELVGLHKRQWKLGHSDNPLLGEIEARLECHHTSPERMRAYGPAPASRLLKRGAEAARGLPLKPLTRPLAKQLKGLSRSMEIQGIILEIFVPFTATHSYRFSCQNARAALSRLSAQEQAVVPWRPESIDWRHYILDIHGPGLQENVASELEEKLKKTTKALRAYDNLVDLQDELAERHDLATALQVTHPDGFQSISYREFRQRSVAASLRLAQAGIKPGDRVILSAENHPDWPIAYFGALRAGAVVVPVEAGLSTPQVLNIESACQASLAILDQEGADALSAELSCKVMDLHAVSDHGPTQGAPEHAPESKELASILFTSGTTGVPKGVMLSHQNFCALLGSLAATFPLTERDRVLSVLPLHHTFEFSCGLLLPLSRGARVLYLDEINGERLSYGLREGKITAMVGVPALWQLLERRIRNQVSDKGRGFEIAFDAGLELNRMLGKATGLDIGRVMFGQVHERLGGNIRFLISGAAALPKQTQELFQGLGLHLAEGYGLTEAAPVLSVAKGKPGARSGHVGKPVPGVEIKIHKPDSQGIGQVIARGPNVMMGYYGDEQASAQALQDGWLYTGDLGKIDHRGHLNIMGRAKEVVVTASGENIYLDDVENALGPDHDFVKEYGLVGLDDPRGGERLGMLVVADAEENPGIDRVNLHSKAKTSLLKAIGKLPNNQRPSVIHFVDADLPRTKTRKVKRGDVRAILEKIHAASLSTVKKGDNLAGPVAQAIASVAGVSASQVTTTTHMTEDLHFDSLMWVELASAMEAMGAGAPDADELSKVETVADVVRLAGAPTVTIEVEEDVRDKVELPDIIADPLKAGLGFLQRELYQTGLQCKIYGRAFIPQNRQTIVVSNHCSHLDMGLVKYALGPYGHKLVALAAQDYFFEGNKYVVAYFERLTNLQPIDRKRGFRASLRQAIDVVRANNVVLLFPEGTRRTDGSIGEFRPLVGWLSMDTNVDILPMHLDGTFEALPKGAVLPRGRDLKVRIGPPIEVAEVRRLTKGMKPAMAARHAARLAQRAVEALRDGQVLDLRRLEPEDLEELGQKRANPTDLAFKSLRARYDSERVKKPVSWYFSLGGKQGLRFHVLVDDEKVIVGQGKPPSGAADCVVKTSEEMMRKIIVEGYIPEPPEFFSGVIKSNDIPLLIEFSRVFGLSEVQS